MSTEFWREKLFGHVDLEDREGDEKITLI